MTFFPVEFWGLRVCGLPLLGWQGIIPMKAKEMSEKSCDIITTKLLGVKEVFSRLDAKEFTAVARPHLERDVERIVDRILLECFPRAVVESLPAHIRAEIVATVMEDAPALMEGILNDMKEEIEHVFDLKGTVVRVMLRDKMLMIRMFQTCGAPEFKFIQDSGAYFGFLFGLIQMAIWIGYSQWWTLPVFGLVVGYATNWVAIFLIFRPVEPRTYCGFRSCCGRKFQGLFLQRQLEVSRAYAKLVSDEVLKARHLIEDLEIGQGAFRLYEIVKRRVDASINAKAGGFPSVLAQIALGPDTIPKMKEIAAGMTMCSLPRMMIAVEEYMKEALSVEAILFARLHVLPSRDFEQMLHPVFEEDEWKLILVGGILGMLVGFAQAGIDRLIAGA